MQIILASTSRYRREMLTRCGIEFASASPMCNETPLAGETVPETVARLAELKARSIAPNHANSLIIGADQLASLDGLPIGKPSSLTHALETLVRMSNRTMIFYSALALLNTATQTIQTAVEPTEVRLRSIDQALAQRYLSREPEALHCAGAIKSEGLGSILIAQVTTGDPNALIGLPLFRLIDMLMNEGVTFL